MRKSILVVDDSPDIQQILTLFLEGHGHKVLSTDSPNEAIDIVKTAKPDVVLLDYLMPGLTPNAFVNIVRSQKSNICIILVSGISDVSAKAKSLGLEFAIQKPFDPDALLELITQAGNRMRLNGLCVPFLGLQIPRLKSLLKKQDHY